MADLHTVTLEEVELYCADRVDLPTAVCGTVIDDSEVADSPDSPRCPACVEARPDLEPYLGEDVGTEPAYGYVYDGSVQMRKPWYRA